MRGSKDVLLADQAATASKRKVVVQHVAIPYGGHVREFLGIGGDAADNQSRRNVALLLRQVESREIERQSGELNLLLAELCVLSAL